MRGSEQRRDWWMYFHFGVCSVCEYLFLQPHWCVITRENVARFSKEKLHFESTRWTRLVALTRLLSHVCRQFLRFCDFVLLKLSISFARCWIKVRCNIVEKIPSLIPPMNFISRRLFVYCDEVVCPLKHLSRMKKRSMKRINNSIDFPWRLWKVCFQQPTRAVGGGLKNKVLNWFARLGGTKLSHFFSILPISYIGQIYWKLPKVDN